MLTLTTLGHLELLRDDRPVLSGRRKLLAVIARLARARGRGLSRSQLASMFWPGMDEVRARRSVRQALTELRRVLGPALREQTDSLAIDTEQIEVDALSLEAASSAGDYSRVMELWRGDFLPGLEDLAGEEFRSWLDAERQGLRSHLAFAAEQLVDREERQGAWEAGLKWSEVWISAFPTDERAHARHIRLLTLAGRRGEAITARGTFVHRLREELEAEPSAAFQSLTAAALASHDEDTGNPRPAGKGLLSPDLVARETEFAMLTSLWREVAGGAGGVVLIEGEDGSGKTRLVQEFLRWLGQAEPTPVVLFVRAFEAEATRPRVLLRHLLAGLASAPGLAAAPPAVLSLLGRLAPEIRDRFPGPAPGEEDVAPAEAIARAIADVAAEVPVVLVADDAHHADPESREVLEALCRRPVSGALVILTVRPEAFAEFADRDNGKDRLIRINLEPLSEAEVERLLGGMAEFAPDDRRALAVRLHAGSGGNPLAAVELLMTLADRGVIAPRPDGRWTVQANLEDHRLPLPVSIRNAASARLRQLAEETTRILEAAAVLGREAEPAVLRAVTGSDAPALDQGLSQLINGRFLRLAGDGSLRLEFVHEIVRQVVYQEMPTGRRQRMHRRAWKALRRGKAADGTRLAAVSHHQAHMGPRTISKPLLLAASILLAVAIGGGALLAGRTRATPSPTTIAVLPFTVQSEGPSAYLGEGMVTLLGAALDGLGGLQTADSRGVLSFVAQRTPTPELGRDAARHVGAGLYVLGDLVETNGRIEMEASLYDGGGRLQTTARATAETESGLYAVVDELAKQLAVNRRTGPAQEIARAAAATTASLPALKSYLEGERRLRAGDFSAAVESFRSAVSADTTFALAYYRLAIAAEWDQRPALPEWAARQAARYGDRLTERTRGLVEALLAWRRGHLVEAYDGYHSILVRYPKDVEAWFQQGELLFHAGPVLGWPIAEARKPWTEVLALEPDNRFAMLHLARIAGAQADSTAMDALVPRLPELDPNGDRRLLELAAWRALVLRSPSEEERVRRAFQRPVPTTTVVWQLAAYSRDLEATERFIGYLYPANPSTANNLTLQLELARGQWRAADTRLNSAQGMDPERIIARAYVSSLPFVEMTPGELGRVRDELASWTAPPPRQDRDDPKLTSYNSLVYSQLQRYLLGTLSVRAGDLQRARRYAEELQGMPRPPWAESLLGDLVLGLRAMTERAEGRPETALKLLESMQPRATQQEAFTSPIYSRALERYHRAELLREMGRGDAALAWYKSMAQLSPYELIFLAPAHLGQAQVYQAEGRAAEAKHHYDRFVEIWKDADPGSQFRVARARAALEAVSGER